MTVAAGTYIRPNFAKAWTPGPVNTLGDPKFAGVVDLEILGGYTATGRQASFGFLPSIQMTFWQAKGQMSGTPTYGTPISDAGVRYVMFDDTPAQTVVNKYLHSDVVTLCFAAAHSFYVGQFVTVAGVSATFNGTFLVTAVNTAISGSNITTAYNISYSTVQTNVAGAASGGTVASAASNNYTTVTGGSATMPQSTINVVSTTGFPSSGTFQLCTSQTAETVTYTGKTSSTFTGCTGTGTGTINTGTVVTQPFTNIVDTTGLNTNNLGPREWIDYMRLLYASQSVCTAYRTDTVTNSKGSATITDASILATDQGAPCRLSTGQVGFVGAPVASTSFTFVDSTGSAVITTGAATSAKLLNMPILEITLRLGAVDSSRNMEKATAWQQISAGVDDWNPSRIIGGAHDPWIVAFFSQLGDYLYANQTQVIQIRLDQEMNGVSYSWCYNNQAVDPVTNIVSSATPDNGPSLLNALTPTVTSGNPVASYGLGPQLMRHVFLLAKSTVLAQLENVHGMSSTPATTLAANMKTVQCLGSGSITTPNGSAPNPEPLWPQIGNITGGGVSPFPAPQSYTITGITTNGGNTVITVNPGSGTIGGNTVNYYGHGIMPGALVGPSVSVTTGDTVTAITNVTITMTTAGLNNTYTVGGQITLTNMTNYVKNVGPWGLFYAGDDAVDIISIDGYNPGNNFASSSSPSLGATWKFFENSSVPTNSDIYGNLTTNPGAYYALTNITSKPMELSESGCIEYPTTLNLNGVPTAVPNPNSFSKAGWITSNLYTGGQLLTNLTAVTQYIYFDQGGQGTGYQLRTSTAAFNAWQGLATDASWSNLGVLSSFPPIASGVSTQVIILRSNLDASLQTETSGIPVAGSGGAELALTTDNKKLYYGDLASQFSTLPFLPFPTNAQSAGEVLTAIDGNTASWQAAATAPGSSNGIAVLSSDFTMSGSAAAQSVLTSGSLTAGAWYLLTGSMLIGEVTATAPGDVYFTLGTATLTSGTLVGTSVAKATAIAGFVGATISCVVQIANAGTIILSCFPPADAWLAKRYTQGGATTIPATWLQWVRIA